MNEKGMAEDLASRMKSLEEELNIYKSEYASLLNYNCELRNENQNLRNSLQQITESDSYNVLLKIKRIYNAIVPNFITAFFKRVGRHGTISTNTKTVDLHLEPQNDMHCSCCNKRIDIILVSEQKSNVAEFFRTLIRNAGL